MPIVLDKDRKSAFSQRLKDKRERPSDEKAEMTSDELRAFKKFIADANRNVENASCVVEEPSLRTGEGIG